MVISSYKWKFLESDENRLTKQTNKINAEERQRKVWYLNIYVGTSELCNALFKYIHEIILIIYTNMKLF